MLVLACLLSMMVLIVAGKPPLYFQHEGHSRTIIGIERYKPTEPSKGRRRTQSSNRLCDEGYLYNLLLLDPSYKTNKLAQAMKTGNGWQVCCVMLLLYVHYSYICVLLFLLT